MNATEIALRFVTGGSLVVAITILAKTRYTLLSGAIMLFPAVSLVAYYFVGQTADPVQLKEITKFSMYGLSAMVAFLLAFYYAQKAYSVTNSLLIALAAWLIAAAIVVGLTR